ncbi:MAG TPA: VOC family protein [Acidobacteriaceae bacterium]|jgi:glyoxylase I family protein|nr:VOC family protein [Acidobacteriaceae bacterium]
MISGIEHIAIASFDPHRLAEWYVRHLNFIVVLDTGKTVYLRAGNHVVLEFVYADTQPAAPSIRDAGLRHIAFSVMDIDAAREELQANGVKFPDDPIVAPGMRLQFFQDPEGNFLHLVEREIPLKLEY